MKKSFFILTLVIFAVLAAASVKASGAIPTSYNSTAQSILSMLWDKLDSANVSNYDVSMLLRYHDHGGSDPGDFVTRGKPISTIGLADGAATAVKLSTAARKHVVSLYVGDIAAGTGDERPFFISPGNETVTGVGFADQSGIVQNDTNYTNIGIWRWRAGSFAEIKEINTKTTISGGTAISGSWQPVRVTSGLATTSLAAGDTVTFYKNDTGTGAAVTHMAVTLEYIVSE